MSGFSAEHWAFVAVVGMMLLAQLGLARLAGMTFVLAVALMVFSVRGEREKGWAMVSFAGLAVAAYSLHARGVRRRKMLRSDDAADGEIRGRLEELSRRRDTLAREQEIVEAELEANHRLFQMSRDLGSVIEMNEFHRELARIVVEMLRPEEAVLLYLDTERGVPHTYRAYELGREGAVPCGALPGSHPVWEHFRDPTGAGILSAVQTESGEEVVVFLSYHKRIIGGIYARGVKPPSSIAMDFRLLIYTLAVQVNMAANKCLLYLEIEKMSRHDGLTGLYKRWYFIELLEVELLRSRGEGRPLTVLMVDIDHFKDFNDTHGHLAGDRVLSAVAVYLKEHIRVQDVLCRYGGEEFMVVLPDTPAEGALVVAERLRQALSERSLQVGSFVTNITISIGGATFPRDADSIDGCLLYTSPSPRDRTRSRMPSSA